MEKNSLITPKVVKQMSLKKITIPLLFGLLVNFTYGQKGVIEGRVYNSKNNTPVEFASIAIFGTSIGSISDLDGNFLFTGLEPGFVELRVSSVGFENYVSEAIQITNSGKTFIEIPLLSYGFHFAGQQGCGFRSVRRRAGNIDCRRKILWHGGALQKQGPL